MAIKMKKVKQYWFIFPLAFVFSVLCFLFFYAKKTKITYPVAEQTIIESQVLGSYEREASGEPEEALNIVYGFLPYWNVDNYQLHPAVTHLSYFRLAVNGKGQIEDDSAYQIYQSDHYKQILAQLDRNKIKVELTIFTSHSDEIEALLACYECQDYLIDRIDTLVGENQLDGINLDLEYLGYVSEEQRNVMTNFIYRLQSMLKRKYPRTRLSLDVYGGAANMNNLWDFPKLSMIVDRILVMGYDYKTKKSSVPGPTAPTLGKNVWGGDIWEDIRSLLRFVPSEKVVLVVPFYGYAWVTTTDNLDTAKTYPDTGETLTYRGAQNILSDPEMQAQERWDERSLTPYLVFPDQTDPERWHIGFFENARSLGYKIDLIDQLDLGGMAIWALGYEGEYRELWDVISKDELRINSRLR